MLEKTITDRARRDQLVDERATAALITRERAWRNRSELDIRIEMDHALTRHALAHSSAPRGTPVSSVVRP